MVNQYVPYTIKLNETSMSLTQIKGNQNLMNRLTPGKTKLKPLIFVSFFLLNHFVHGGIFVPLCTNWLSKIFFHLCFVQFSNMISVTEPFQSKNTSHCLIIDYKTERTFQKLQLKTDLKGCQQIRDILISHRVAIQSEQSQRNQRRRQSNILF